jgi:hypothetical protein
VNVDYKFHDLGGIRLIDAHPPDAALVTRQLGLQPAPFSGEPLVLVRFVDRLKLADQADPNGVIRFVGMEESAFSEESFFLIRSNNGKRARMQVDFDALGSGVVLTCERGLREIPFLIQLLNLSISANGILPLHASAFTYHGKGILTAGWSQGGKTEALLAFMANGAELIGDEWVYLHQGGNCAAGLPMPLRVRDWHLAELPQYRAYLSLSERNRLRVVRALLCTARGFQSLPWLGRSGFGRLAERSEAVFKQRLLIETHPQKLFGERAAVFKGRVDKLFFIVIHQKPEVSVKPADPQEIALRMEASLSYERLGFLGYYLKFRFAFPERSSQLVDQAANRERELLLQMLSEKEAYEVRHPYPFSLHNLYEVMKPYCQ